MILLQIARSCIADWCVYGRTARWLVLERPPLESEWPSTVVARVTIQTIKHSEHFGQELKEHTTSMTHMLSRIEQKLVYSISVERSLGSQLMWYRPAVLLRVLNTTLTLPQQRAEQHVPLHWLVVPLQYAWVPENEVRVGRSKKNRLRGAQNCYIQYTAFYSTYSAPGTYLVPVPAPPILSAHPNPAPQWWCSHPNIASGSGRPWTCQFFWTSMIRAY